MEPEWILVVIAIVTAIITAVYFGIHLKHLHKENKREGLLERFNRFNKSKSKKARKIMINSNFKPDGDYIGDKKSDDFRLFKEELGELDTTAHLIRKGYVDKNDFLELLAGIIIVCFTKSKSYIEFVRKERHQEETKYYAKQFEWLNEQAEKWWKKNVSKILPKPDELDL